MEKSNYAEKLVAERFQEEIDNICECKYCHTSRLIGAVTSPHPDGKNRIVFCMNHQGRGVILSRFEYNPA
jgi:hypothetical protein